jgi:hypothetical protein
MTQDARSGISAKMVGLENDIPVSTVCYSRSRVLRRTAEFLFDLLTTKEKWGRTEKKRTAIRSLSFFISSKQSCHIYWNERRRDPSWRLTVNFRPPHSLSLSLVDAVSFTVDRKDSSLFSFIAACLFSSLPTDHNRHSFRTQTSPIY